MKEKRGFSDISKGKKVNVYEKGRTTVVGGISCMQGEKHKFLQGID